LASILPFSTQEEWAAILFEVGNIMAAILPSCAPDKGNKWQICCLSLLQSLETMDIHPVILNPESGNHGQCADFAVFMSFLTAEFR
jgi:hypothetical protein